MEEKNIPIEKKIFRDVYIFYEKYASREQTDEYWKEVVEEMGRITNFYKGCTLCNYLTCSVFFHFESGQCSNKAKVIFKDVYMFYRKYLDKIQDDDYLKEALEESEKLFDCYKEDDLYNTLIVSVVRYLGGLRQM